MSAYNWQYRKKKNEKKNFFSVHLFDCIKKLCYSKWGVLVILSKSFYFLVCHLCWLFLHGNTWTICHQLLYLCRIKSRCGSIWLQQGFWLSYSFRTISCVDAAENEFWAGLTINSYSRPAKKNFPYVIDFQLQYMCT